MRQYPGSVVPLAMFKSRLRLKKNVFSHPLTLFRNWLKTTHSKLIKWKCRLETNLTHVFSAISPLRWPKISKHTCFSMMWRSPMVATNAVTQPRLLNHQCFKAKNTQAHSGEKPFVYTHCSYSCTTAGSLKRHMLKHSFPARQRVP